MEEPIRLPSLPREKVITYTPLVYNADTDFSTITNVLLVDTNVQDYNKFVENVNSSTFAITFSQGSKGQDIVDLLAAKLPNINRIAIVANDSMLAADKRLFSYKPYFESSDLELEMDTTRTSYSENLQLLIDLIKAHSVQTIDFLACSSLTFDNWKAYYSILTKETGVTVGASNDQTGNILSGGDWTMESTGVDIEAIYFSSGISNYQGTLAITLIGGNVTLSMGDGGVVYSQDDGPETPMSWPCTLQGTITVTLGEDLTLNAENNYFIILNADSNDVTIDGANYTIKVDGVNNYPGLVRSRSNNTLVKNIDLLSSDGTTLARGGGWIGQGDLSGILSFIGTIDNCYSRGIISAEFSGGIAGDGSGFGGICTITNCHSTGDISGLSSGGIAGDYAGSIGTCNIRNCHSTGAISGEQSGGIAGGNAGHNTGTCTITGCHSTGAISGNQSGGIAGSNAGYYGNCEISNCYSTGAITDDGSGGIVGDNAGYDGGTCTITNCYSTGAISGNGSGGIAGEYAGGDGGTCTITNCYSTGAISDQNSGGIAGSNAGYDGNCEISNCYSTGAITGDGSGGIAGSNAGYDGICEISNCYTTGDIDGNNSGGIGGNNGATTCTIDHCYTVGAITGTDSDGIVPANSSATVENSSHSNGWLDRTAREYLQNIGTVWKLIYGDFPYKLSSFLTSAIVTYTYDGSTLVYNSSLFPIVTYGSGVLPDPKIQLLYDGVAVGSPEDVNTTQRSITFNSVSGLDNGQSTTLQLLSGTTSYDYLNVLIISTTTTTSTTSTTTSTTTAAPTSTTTSTTTAAPTSTTTSTTTKRPATTTTSTTTLPPTQYSEVEFAIAAPFSLLNTPANKANYEVTLKAKVVDVTDAPPNTVTVIGVRSGSIINTVRLPTIYVQLLQNSIQSGAFEITINGVIYGAIPGSFVILDNICFQKGTMILTPNGYRAVESLNSGDLVKTSQGRITKVQTVVSFIGKVDKCPLYVLKKGVLGANKPIADLYMSEGHAYRNRGYWCHMKCSSVTVKLREDNIEYYNIVLDNYFEHTLVANGVEVESLFRVSGLEMTWNCDKDHCKPIISLKKQ